MTISVFHALRLNGDALSAQRSRLDVVSSNLANAETTRTPEGGPYRRRDVALATEVARGRFGGVLHDELMEPTRAVRVEEVVADPSPPRMVFDPTHPDADPNGFVAMPNINAVEEMVNMVTVMRSYQANLSVFNSLREMTTRALTLGRSF